MIFDRQEIHNLPNNDAEFLDSEKRDPEKAGIKEVNPKEFTMISITINYYTTSKEMWFHRTRKNNTTKQMC